MSRAGDRNFALVIFSQVPEFYVTDQNVDCHFTVTAGVDISKWDWIGLYRVGWSKQNQQICYEWVPAAPSDASGERNLCIQFPSHSLPKEEGEFYQFVYISSARGTIGCSTPFQFRKPRATDYVEEEFEDMMVVRSKSTVMQEKIQFLEKELGLFKEGRAKLEIRVQSLEAEIAARDHLISSLRDDLADSQRKENMSQEAHDRVSQELEEKQLMLEEMYQMKEQLEQYQLTASKSLAEVNRKTLEMMATIKELQSEKDALCGQNKSLVDELASYKDQVTESQSAAASKVKEVALLTGLLQEMEERSEASEALLKQLEAGSRQKDKELQQRAEQLAVTRATLQSVEEECNTLRNEVQNSEDMLDACQSMKDKMLQDLRAYEQTQTKMSTQVEAQESARRELKEAVRRKSEECDSLSQVVQRLEEEAADKDQRLTRAQLQAASAQDDLATTKSQLQACAQQVKELEKNMEETVENCAVQIQSVYNQLDETRKALEKLKLKAADDAQELERLRVENNELASNQQQAAEQTEKMVQLKQASDEAETKVKRRLHKQEKEIEGWLAEMTAKDDRIAKYKEEISRLIVNVENFGSALEERNRAEQAAKEELASKDEIISTIQRDLQRCQKEMGLLRGKLAQSKEKEEAGATAHRKEAGDEDAIFTDPEGPWFALKMASEELRVRLEDRTKEVNTLKLEKKERDVELENCRKDARDLRQRLEMARREYTKLMADSNKIIRKLQKHKGLTRSISLNTPPSHQESPEEPAAARAADEANIQKQPSGHKEVAPGHAKRPPQPAAEDREDKHWALKEQNLGLWVENLELKKLNAKLMEKCEEKEKEVMKLEKRLLRLQMDDQGSQEGAFHDTAPSVSDDASTSSVDREVWSPAPQTDDDDAEAEAEDFRIPAVTLIYPNPYSLHRSKARGPEREETVVYVPTTEEDVTPGLLDPMSSSSLEEDSDLPRPLDPEVMPQAKLAAVKQQIGCAANTSDIDDHLLFEDCSPELPAPEERFMDAIGESMNICPECHASELTSGAFQEHVASHLGRICPMCKSMADDVMTHEDFVKHVNRCCEQAAQEEADKA